MHIQSTRAVIIAAALAVSGATAAQAEHATARYYRHELTTAAGQHAVLARMQRAARFACETDDTLQARLSAKACAKELTAQMVAGSGSTALAALHGAKGVQLASSDR